MTLLDVVRVVTLILLVVVFSLQLIEYLKYDDEDKPTRLKLLGITLCFILAKIVDVVSLAVGKDWMFTQLQTDTFHAIALLWAAWTWFYIYVFDRHKTKETQ